MNEKREGRPRCYTLNPLEAAPPEAGRFAALLDEAKARVIDLIVDLSPGQLALVPSGLGNSIQMLVSHMTWTETTWIERATGRPLPDDLAAARPEGPFPVLDRTAAQLIGEIRRANELYVHPALQSATDLDAVVAPERPGPRGLEAFSLRGVLMHMIWHWTYHGGQVGLVRRLAGAGYQWTMEPRMFGRA